MQPDATALAELVRTGRATPRELVEEAVAGLRRVDPDLQAVVHDRTEQALAEAAGPLPDGPLRGVPFVVKDLAMQTAGDPYHGGTRLLQRLDWRADHDTHLATAFRAAGLVTIAKTKTPELGSVPTTEPLAHGPAHNPWDLGRSPGGSSGGSAALVAAGVVPVGHGGDGGGSLRCPAASCGIIGLKPSRGRISPGPDLGEMWAGFATEGVMTRTVRDMALFLDVMAGARPGDPYTAVPPVRPFVAEVGAAPGRLRIGIAGGLGDVVVDPACRAAVEATAALLADLGHDVAAAHPAALDDIDRFLRSFGAVVAAQTAAEVDALEAMVGRPVGPDDLEPSNLFVVERGRRMTTGAYLAALGRLHAYTREIAGFWDAGYDLLVLPTLPVPSTPLGWFGEGHEGRQRVRDHVAFTAPFNVTGQPAISLPLGTDPDGRPVGVQIVGPANGEALLLRIAAQLESTAPWADRRPTVHV
ncbi:MAG: amidase [Actinobacteria bacterium]|nr:amidase [Actinomycetota bacterium]